MTIPPSILRSLALCCLALGAGGASVSAEAVNLEAGFNAPPATARPQVWWQWMDGNVSKAGITADLEAMKAVGVAGATIVNLSFGIPDGPIRFNTPEWTGMVRFAAEESDRLGLALGIENAAGWSSTGGPWNTPEHSMQVVVTSETTVPAAGHFNGKLPQPPAKMDYYQDIAVLAFPTPPNKAAIENLPGKAAVVRQPGLSILAAAPVAAGSVVVAGQIVDLTAETKPDGSLDWSPPGGEGSWTIVRIGHTTTGSINEPAPKEGKGLECDKLSREALKLHWAGMLGKLQADLGPLMGQGQGITSTLIDSYERGDQNWTPKFKEEFLRLRGYDLSPYLPVFAGFVVDSPEKTERFLWDVRRTVADLFTENQYDYFGELGKAAGLKTMLEPYGDGGFEELMCGRNIDEIMGEFWVGWPGVEDTVQIAASSAHIYGKKVVGAEALTSTGPSAANPTHGRWQGTPYIYKQYVDKAFGLGLNHLYFHRFAHQPWPDRFPGMTMGPFGSHIDRTNTWWNQSADWMTYLARCSYLLQQGNPVADLLWFDGENAPSAAPDTWGLPRGYAYDGCTTDVLMDRVKVADHRLVLPDGTSYRALVLPNSGGDTMTPVLIRRIEELSEAGATIAAGPKPTRSPSLGGYPACDAEVKKIADALWDHGKILTGKGPADLVKALNLAPDFEPKSKIARLVFAHRQIDGADLYFVANQKGIFQEADCLFRVSGKAPELWHPDTGEIEPAPAYGEEGGRTHVPLQFEPYGSVFVLFRAKAPDTRHAVAVAPPVPETPPGKLVIKKAVYEGIDGGGSLDVTAKVAEKVQEGTLSILVENIAFSYKDICPGHVGRLAVDYTFNGTPGRKVVVQTDWMDIQDPILDTKLPDYRLRQSAKGDLTLETWKPGAYAVQMSEGDPVTVTSEAPAPVEVTGGWDLRFPPKWGAPDQVSLDTLISWSDSPDAGVKYFSGTATYAKTIDVPATLLGAGKHLSLDLGTVKELARVRLNGKDLGVLWKKPFMVEITGAAKAGANQLEVEVTNLWPNRLIGDEQLPPDTEMSGDHIAKWPQWLLDGKPSPSGRFTFTTWHFWKKDEPLLASGLIGPVTLRPSVEQPVR